jgi:uncharacterized protein (TIGR02679 family)
LRACRDAGRTLPATITLTGPTEDERRRHAALLRLSETSRAQRLRYELKAISNALAVAGAPKDWSEILKILCGPIPTKALAAQASTQAWHNFWPATIASLSAHPFPAHLDWLDALRRDGVLKRLAGGDAPLAARWIDTASRLLRALPLAEDQPLPHTAAHYCGDSHALDPDRPLSTLVLRGVALRKGQTLPSRAPERRALWAEFGVVCDELSAPVLTFNLGLTGEEPLASLLSHATLAIQPLHLSTRLLWATAWKRITCPPRVFVCENPTIVALAATRLGISCPPLVCVDGELKTAARLLLRALRAGGATLHYHGDFDWAGLAIAERIFREFSAQPWLFDHEAYIQACQQQGRPLLGTPIPTSWSPQMSGAMKRVGLAYDEELLVDILLGDLKEAAGAPITPNSGLLSGAR